MSTNKENIHIDKETPRFSQQVGFIHKNKWELSGLLRKPNAYANVHHCS